MRGDMRKLRAADMEIMGLPRRFWGVTLSGVQDGPHREVLVRYVGALESMLRGGMGLLLWGDNGRGKTAAAAVIAKTARAMRHTVSFVSAADLKRMVVEHHRFDERQTMWDRVTTCEFLVLDDVGKGVEDRTGFGEKLLDELVRARSSKMLPLIMTTNVPLATIQDAWKPSTVAALRECAFPVEVVGVDLRTMRKSPLASWLQGEGS